MRTPPLVVGGVAMAALVLVGLGPVAQGEPDILVEVVDFVFRPDKIVIGDLNAPHRITFRNVNEPFGRAHQPIGDPHDHENLDPGACFNAGALFAPGLNARTEVTITLPKACGPVVTFHCHIHNEEGMKGQIVWPTWTPL